MLMQKSKPPHCFFQDLNLKSEEIRTNLEQTTPATPKLKIESKKRGDWSK
jgi:hypothetical protein